MISVSFIANFLLIIIISNTSKSIITQLYLLLKLGQDVCKHSSVFNVLFYRTTLLKQSENVALLWNVQPLAQLLDNL